MKHRILTLLLICLLAAALFGNFAGASFGGGIDHDNDYVPGGDGGGGSWGDSGGGSWGDSDWGDSGDGGGIAFIGGDSGAIVIFYCGCRNLPSGFCRNQKIQSKTQ